VWPFRAPSLRGGYTVNGGRHLVALAGWRSRYSGLTGNVLSGPLHGLMARAEVLGRLGGFTGVLDGRRAEGGPDALGALVGLACLGAGYRNVSSGGVVCAEVPPPVRVGEAAPALDPYL
jgi:hypothetical protein